MKTRNTLRAIALATTCLAPLTAYAQDYALTPPAESPSEAAAPLVVGIVPIHGDVFVGLGGVFGSHPDQAGRYDGLNTGGLDALGQFDIGGRAPWESDGTRFYELNGNNLVFQTGNAFGAGLGSDSGFASSTNNSLVNNGSMGFRFGDQGTWEGGVSYDAITYTGNVIDSLYTINGSQGMLNNNLAPFGGATPGVKGATTAFTIPQLNATGAMLPFQTGTRRDIIGADFKYMWNNWTFTGALRHEHKEGSMEESFDGPWGGTAFGMPINYDTDRYDVSASYNTRSFQSIFQYTYSHFSDNNLFVALPYPTSNTAAPFQRSAAYSLPPSNDAHYLTMMLADNDLIPKTRLNLNARVGLELQNDTFAPNTADPGGANLTGANLTGLNSALQGTTAGSPDMMATVYQVKASASSRPLPNVDTRFYYGVDGRSVSLNQYNVFTGGTGGAAADTTPGGATNFDTVVPQDWLKQNAGGDVGYMILPESETKVTVGYRFDKIDRSNAQAGHSSTSTGTIGVMSQITSQVDGKLTFAYADRTGALNYLGPWEFLGGSPTYSGAFYQAPMTSESVTARADYTPMNKISSGLFIQFKNENYTYSSATLSNGGTLATLPLTGTGEGIKQDLALVVGPDLNYRPTESLNIHIFYTYELLFFNNLGNGACSTAAEAATAACAGTAGYFQNKDTTSTNTIGLSGDWKINEKLTLRGDYTLSYGSVMFGQFNGVFVPNPTTSYQNVTNYPDINSLMNSVKLTAIYEVQTNVQLILQGVYTSFHNNDWDNDANAIQGAGTSAIALLTPGYASPNYSIAALMAGVRIRF
jgi:hypothetical protein